MYSCNDSNDNDSFHPINQSNNKKKILSEQVDSSELELTSMKARVSSSDEAEKICMIKKQVVDLNTRINTEDAERISLTSEITKSETEIKRLEDEKDEYADLIKRWRIFSKDFDAHDDFCPVASATVVRRKIPVLLIIISQRSYVTDSR